MIFTLVPASVFAKGGGGHNPPKKYTVTFNSNGGSAVDSITVYSGEKITAPNPNPTWDGHTFEGWYKDSGLTRKWKFNSDKVTENLTLYAKWKEDTKPPTKYTVKFDTDGGTPEPPDQEVISGTKATDPGNPTKTGFTFEGWFAEGRDDPWVFDEDTVTGTLTLTAKWKANVYTVKFDSKNGTSVADASVKHGETVTKPTNPTRSGYSFGGWYKDEKYTNAWSFNTPITSDITLYARWYSNSSSVPLYYNYVYVTPTTDVLVIPKTGGMVSLLPYALLSASALCAVLLRKRKED